MGKRLPKSGATSKTKPAGPGTKAGSDKARKPESTPPLGHLPAGLAERILEGMRVRPGQRVRLDQIDPDDNLGLDKDRAAALLERNRARMAELHELLWADDTRALLVVLQGMDTSGKDGLIRHVMTGLNPQGCKVVSFKVPSDEERDHDFLWRVHKRVPAKGEIGIFNRSHYEGVLAERVLGIVPPSVWRQRYNQINEFEELLEESGTHVVKFFLHISRDEQKARLEARLADPTKNWKFSLHDLDTRKRWDDYRAAFEDLLTKCSAHRAPWYVIPANRKWVRNLAASTIILRELESMRLRWPKPRLDVGSIRID